MKVLGLFSLLIIFGVSSVGVAMPAEIILIRHAEKPDTGDDLSQRGWQRAYALVGYFQHNPDVTRFGTPAAIYAMNPGKIDGSRRAIETVAPLAKALNMQINNRYTKEEIEPLFKEIMNAPQYNGRMVLICWEHKMIPKMAPYLGLPQAPQKWPDSVFDWTWRVDYAGGRPVGFRTFWQHLLPGDN